LKGKKISYTKLKKRTTLEGQFQKKIKSNKLTLRAILKIKIKCKNSLNKRKKRENKCYFKKKKDKKELGIIN